MFAVFTVLSHTTLFGRGVIQCLHFSLLPDKLHAQDEKHGSNTCVKIS